MAITFEEQLAGRTRQIEFGRSSMSLAYRAYATEGETESDVEVAAVAYFQGISFDDRFFSNLSIDNQLSADTWDLTVRFAGRGTWSDSAPEALPAGFSFSTLGATAKIQTPLRLIQAYGKNASEIRGESIVALDNNGREVTTLDIPDRVFNFSVKRQFSPMFVTTSYVHTIERLTGSTNTQSFFGRDPGSVLFLGAQGSRQGSDAWQLTYEFASRLNRTIANNPILIPGIVYAEGMDRPSGYEIGDMIPIEKAGWENLVVDFNVVVDDDAHRITSAPSGAYVQQVLPEADFAELLL